MLYKSRTKPTELRIFELLNARMKLSNRLRDRYLSFKKGYEGEKRFDSLTEKLQCECLILNDLLLEVTNTTFQIDTLIITKRKINAFEVKNFEGDHYYTADKLFKKPNFEIINPLHQLSRSESLLCQLLSNLGVNLPVETSLVFINPEFTLYQAPMNQSIIFPSQLNRYLKQFNAQPGKLTKSDKQLADQLLTLHMTKSPFDRLPAYDFDQLRKGIACPKCHSIAMHTEKRTCVCQKCGCKEPRDDAILRSSKEYKILFPDERMTTNRIYDWCQAVASKKVIRRILANHFRVVGVHQWTYYE
ncbi:NERD domain-containing protein [Lentibacillus cibarius]|uniref:NERD domain-containing protein n=1 Tax=Lentibacillus cibarius TaxID=2583219 RepID=A0A549YJ52_9BACI|nr:NERD domain-containing protein [Lentibacillus cibarius]